MYALRDRQTTDKRQQHRGDDDTHEIGSEPHEQMACAHLNTFLMSAGFEDTSGPNLEA